MKKKIDLSLYLITDRKIIGNKNIIEFLSDAIKGGVTAIQLREKECTTREFIQLARQAKTLLQDYDIPLIINDRLDVALAVDADGVHIGQNDIEYVDARRILGNEKTIGVSVETISQVQEAIKNNVDYISISPIFLTPTKPDVQTFWGLDGLREVRKLTSKYLVAIGGINISNARAVLEAGADGIAVVSAICASDNPEYAARNLKSIIDQYKRSCIK